MYKKLLYVTMALNTLLIMGSVLILIMMGKLILPLSIMVLSITLGFFGIVLIVRSIVLKGSRLYQLILYHLLQIAVTCINLLLILNFPMAISIFDVFIIGTLVHVFISAFLVYLSLKNHRYQIQKARYLNSKSKSNC
ncbi:MAG: hypothetical protein RRZ73_06700 [Oscillospiraceae bacterium]